MANYTIHPALGVARVGDSPDEFFIGPEVPGVLLDPPGGFKDGECRVKRQAARFWVFKDGAPLFASDSVTIKWTVHVANRKWQAPNAIQPPAQSLDRPLQSAMLDGGTIGSMHLPVSLGEIRTDELGRLIVLGGHGKGGALNSELAYDDVSDGLIQAEINENGNIYNRTAWVVVAPPKFAPQLESIVTLYDVLLDYAIAKGFRNALATPSYVKDIYPILLRAERAQWIDRQAVAHHFGPHPITAASAAANGTPTPQQIVRRLITPLDYAGPVHTLSGPNANMPDGVGTLTSEQYRIMQEFSVGNFVNDWPPPAPPAPGTAPSGDGLDRAALDGCIGGPFAAGIELALNANENAGQRWMNSSGTPHIDPNDPFRVPTSYFNPGDLTRDLDLWHGDMLEAGCQLDWPFVVPRTVLPQGSTVGVDWLEGISGQTDAVSMWHTLGFVVQQGDQFVQVDRCDSALSIALLTPVLDFGNVPTKPSGVPGSGLRAIEFEVVTSSQTNLKIATLPQNPRFVPDLPSQAPYEVTVPATGGGVAIARFWVRYTTGTAGDPPDTDSVVITHEPTGQFWVVPLLALTIARTPTATALVLDRSGSMSEDPHHPPIKYDSLRNAAKLFEDVADDEDYVALVSFDDQKEIVKPLAKLANARGDQESAIDGGAFAPRGSTSIGGGIVKAHSALDGTSLTKAMLILTDGEENTAPFVSDVANLVDGHVYAIGLGRPENTSAPVLQALSGNNGGYLLVTGDIGSASSTALTNKFLLEKYFLQILASINKADVLLDPSGIVVAGHETAIPFHVTDADAGLDVILVTDSPELLDFRLCSPTGKIVDASIATIDSNQSFVVSSGVAFYRLVLPVTLPASGQQYAGTWHALLRLQTRGSGQNFKTDGRVQVGRRTAAYDLIVHTYSQISLSASYAQSGYDPGATAELRASLLDTGVRPIEDASVKATVTRPDGSQFSLAFHAVVSQPGQYHAALSLPDSGVYSCRVQAWGTTKGQPFTRERLLTPAVWHGGDRVAREPPSSHEGSPGCCRPLGLDVSRRAELALGRAASTYLDHIDELLASFAPSK